MARPASSLLDQIDQGALDSAAPLADVLRKCVALGGRARSEGLRDWARRELDGYKDDRAELPAYRVVPAAICIDGSDLAKRVTGQQISKFELPEFARETIKDQAPMPYGVAELEKLAASGDFIRVQHPSMADLVLYMNSQASYGTSFASMYWNVSPMAVGGILDTIRTNVVALVAEIRAADQTDSADVPSADAANQAVNIVVNNARRSPVTVNTNQAVGANDGTQTNSQEPPAGKQPLGPAWVRGPWTIAVGAAGIVAAVAGVAVWAEWSPFS